MVASVASGPDLLRLVLVPALGWAAWRDYQTRRVPSWLWWPLIGLGALLLVWEGGGVVTQRGPAGRLFLLRTGLSVGLLGLLGLAFYRFRLLGAADAKAIIALAVLVPTYPTYDLGPVLLPIVRPPLGVFSLTILTNSALVGLLYPAGLAVRNLVDGEISRGMFLGRRVHWSTVRSAHGRLAETPAGRTLSGLDLDALRMYLRWRRATLDDLRSDPDGLRDPTTVPDDPGDPTDGRPAPAAEVSTAATGQGADPGSRHGGPAVDAASDDPWAAERFLSSVDSAYGTTAEELRAGLELLSQSETVRISPGLPYLVPVFVGLIVGVVYGDLLYAGLGAVGVF